MYYNMLLFNNASFPDNTNTNREYFNEFVNRLLDQTKDNINRSIQESKIQIPQFNNIVNSYQEQTLQDVREISENFIESQKTIIRSIQSAWGPYQRNFNTSVNIWNSPEAAANAYSRFVSNIADNNITAIQHAKDTSKQIFDMNAKTAQTFEQNSREVARAAQDANTRFSDSINS